jgi:hypothetical protein
VRWHGEGGWREWGPCGAARLPGPVVRRRRPSGVREACGGRVGRVATVRDGLPRHCGRRRWVGSARPHGPPRALTASPGSPRLAPASTARCCRRSHIDSGVVAACGVAIPQRLPSRSACCPPGRSQPRVAHNLGQPTTSGRPQQFFPDGRCDRRWHLGVGTADRRAPGGLPAARTDQRTPSNSLAPTPVDTKARADSRPPAPVRQT